MPSYSLFPSLAKLVLVGYGQAAVRAAYRQQRGLLRLQLRRSFVDGLRLVFVGIIYCFPAILTLLLALSTSDTPEPETVGGVLGIVYPIIMLTYFRISGEMGRAGACEQKPTVMHLASSETLCFQLFQLHVINAVSVAGR